LPTGEKSEKKPSPHGGLLGKRKKKGGGKKSLKKGEEYGKVIFIEKNIRRGRRGERY